MTLQAMTPFGISEAQLKALQDTLAQVPQLEQAIIYGSRAMGTHKTFSDIDIALKGEKLQDEHLSQLNEAIDQLLLPYEVDLTPIAGLSNAALLDHIQRRGKIIYSSQAALNKTDTKTHH